MGLRVFGVSLWVSKDAGLRDALELWDLTSVSSHPTDVPGARMLLPHLEGKQRGGK